MSDASDQLAGFRSKLEEDPTDVDALIGLASLDPRPEYRATMWQRAANATDDVDQKAEAYCGLGNSLAAIDRGKAIQAYTEALRLVQGAPQVEEEGMKIRAEYIHTLELYILLCQNQTPDQLQLMNWLPRPLG